MTLSETDARSIIRLSRETAKELRHFNSPRNSLMPVAEHSETNSIDMISSLAYTSLK